MKINFVLPFVNKTGGILVILEHARHLRKLGHDVRIYYPMLPYYSLLYSVKASPFRKIIGGQLKPLFLNIFGFRKRISWYPYPLPVYRVPLIRNPFIRCADAIIATTWPTAYDVASLRPSAGRKFYFVQGYEQWGFDPALVDGSYRLPLQLLTIAPWLTELMKTKFGRKPRAEILNGIDLEVFKPPAQKGWKTFRILMIYHEQELKGSLDGLAALEEIHRRFPAAEIVTFGPTAFPGKPDYIAFHPSPPLDSIVRLYQSSQVFLCPSWNEGFHLPPMEAMACCCAVVATNVGSIPSLNDGTNMRVVQPRDRAAMADAIAALMNDPAECERMARRGHATIQRFTWDEATAKLADAVRS